MDRRDFIKSAAGAAMYGAWVASTRGSAERSEPTMITVDPAPLHDLSPWLYMHFMEPLGATDGSIEAAWDHLHDRWRPDLIELTKTLAPGMMRWGGLFSAYYRWREGVGPRHARKPMLNLNWGGIESNQVGTAEFVDFCQQVEADPLMCVNFEAEGYRPWAVNAKGDMRAGDANEAADWVRYCNDPDNKERISHGQAAPLPIKIWQIGNETSYSDQRFDRDTAIAKTIEFAKAMRKADPSIRLIGWGDSGWATKMIERAGEHLQYVAFHSLFDPARPDPASPLRNNDYRKYPHATWAALMDGYKIHERKLIEIRQQVEAHKVPLALTECHYTPQGRNRCEVLSSWAAGVSYARFLNLHERHGDVLKIANISDFCGTRWQTNGVMLPVPSGRAFAMPVAKVMALYRRHSGQKYLKVIGSPADLDVAASQSGKTLYLHVINTNMARAQSARIELAGHAFGKAMSYAIAADPMVEIMAAERDPMRVRESEVDVENPVSFPAASVTAIEIQTRPIAPP